MEISRETAEKIHQQLVKANRLASQGKREEARKICLEVYDLCPDYPDTNQILGLLYFQDLDFHSAVKYFERALKHFQEQPFVWLNLGKAYIEVRQTDKAKNAFKKVLKYAPNSAEPYFRLGQLHLASAERKKAVKVFEKTLDLDPKMTQALVQLARVTEKKDLPDLLKRVEERLLADQPPGAKQRPDLAFAAGVCLDRLGFEPEALDFFFTGRSLLHPKPGAWFPKLSETFAKVRHVFEQDLVKNSVPRTAKQITPVFIVGLPRSGSTLLEQIVGAHSKVFAAGEVRFSETLFQALARKTTGQPFPGNLATASPKLLEDLSKNYQDNLKKLCPKKSVFVDKTLSNFHILGLFRMLFPWGKVIHISRNREDTTLSIVKNIFTLATAPYLASPYDIGLYNHLSGELMGFWKKLFPDFILDLTYEDLVNDPKAEIRKVLKFLELEAEDSCLKFKPTDQAIFTPSALQARKPVHAGRIGAAGERPEYLEGFHAAMKAKGPYPLKPPEEVQSQLLRVRDQIREGLFPRARKLCRRILEKDPRQPDAWRALAKIHALNYEYDEAEKALKKSLTVKPNQPGLWVELGTVRTFIRKFEAARYAYLTALCLDEKNVEAVFSLARLALGSGEEARALNLARKALILDPDFAHTYALMLEIPDFEPGPEFTNRLKALAGGQSPEPHAAIVANYALARIYRKTDPERFRKHLVAANAGQKEMAEWETDKNALGVDNAKKIFKAKTFETVAPAKYKKFTPLFIVGQLRSGSTLLEQMLAGHSKVFAADEVHFVNTKLIKACEELTGLPYPEGIDRLDPGQLGEIGLAYQDRMRKIAPEAAFISDKMLSNYYFLGLIYKTMPWAKFIYLKRNAMDTALSIFSNYFSEALPFTFDLAALGRNFKLMNSTVGFWKKHLGEAIFELNYEDLIENPEKEMKKVLKFCGLEWEDAVLEHQKVKRPIQTLSISQVNQPIFKSSVGRWRDFEDLLEPFKKETGDLVDEQGFLKS